MRAASAMAESELRKRSEHPYRMRDLCELTGLTRQAIHFYVQQGLLPAGMKTGRNMAYYSEAHVERLRLIKKLQHERFLPLKAIRAILDDQHSAFDDAQRGFLVGVKRHLTTAQSSEAPEPAKVEDLLARAGVPRRDFERLVELELLTVHRDDDGQEVIAGDDSWIVELWGRVVAMGLPQKTGITVDDVVIYDSAIGSLFVRETQIIAERLSQLEPEDAAQLIEKVLPLIDSLIVGLHQTKVRNFLASIG